MTFNSNISIGTTTSAEINYINSLTLTEFSDESYTAKNNEIQLEIICEPEAKTIGKIICSKFQNYVKNLGDEFFYGAFTDYMRNETYYNIEGYDKFFIQYIFSDKNSNKNNDTISIGTFLTNLNKENAYNNLIILYNYFKDKFSTFSQVEIPDFEKNPINEKAKKNNYLSVLAEIIGTFINNFDKSNEYQDNINSILNYFSCNLELNQAKDFLSVCNFYIVQQKTKKSSGGKKKNLYKQSGGDYFFSIMNRDEKNELLAWDSNINSLIPGKWDTFIKNPIGTYTGEKKHEIDSYINGISTPPTPPTTTPPTPPLRLATTTDGAFYYQNVLNLTFILPQPNSNDLKFLFRVQNSKYNLFNINYFKSTLDFITEIKEKISDSSVTLKDFEMPSNIQDVYPIFISKVGSITDALIEDEPGQAEIKASGKTSGTPSVLKLEPTDKTAAASAIKRLYDFEQAFIVQFKVFIFYGYTKKIQKPGSKAKSEVETATTKATELDALLTPAQKKDFFNSFKTNFANYLKLFTAMESYAKYSLNDKGKNEYLEKKFFELSSIQTINAGYIVSSSIAVISYCLKNNSIPISSTGTVIIPYNETLLISQIDMLNKICLKENLDAAKGAGSIDAELFKAFKTYMQNVTSNYFKELTPGENFSNPTYKIHDRELSKGQKVKFKKPIYGIKSKILYLKNIEENAEILSVEESISKPSQNIYTIQITTGKKKKVGILLEDLLSTPSKTSYNKKDNVKYITKKWVDEEIKIINTDGTVTLKNNDIVNLSDIKLKTPPSAWVDGTIDKIHTKNFVVNTTKIIYEEPDLANIDVTDTTTNIKYRIRDNSQIKEITFNSVEDLIKKPPRPSNSTNLYYISNAVTYKDTPTYFCPYSSIMDGQKTCNTYNSAITSGHPIEEGTINIIVRDGNITGFVAGTGTVAVNAETMRYHVKVEKSNETGEWSNTNDGSKIVKISAYLKINGNVLINIGLVDSYASHSDADEETVNTPIKVNLNVDDSPLVAKVCIKSMMNTAIELLSNDSAGTTIKTWDNYLKIISETTPGPQQTKSGNITNKMFRRKIIEASFKKSLGDYLQEINSIAKNGGYEAGTYLQSTATDGNKVLLPSTLRLGLGNDRPSGIRAAFLILFGKSGINPNSIAGYLTNSGDHALAARDKKNFVGGGSVEKYKIYNKVNNNTKRHKCLTKKRKKLLKNRKISKRNNKGTRKRK